MKVEDLKLPEKVKKEYIESGITELNPPQEKAVEAGLLEGEDMVVASPTASGKTLIAELAMVNQVKKQGGKAIYIVPLKALASEKYRDFSERYSELDVMMSVGDRDESGDYLETADIVIVTSEKLDSMLRHSPSWIHEINLVVTDEIHLLTSPERGPTLEVTLTRLRDVLDFQLLGLSATISNSEEMAEWLDAELVESDYRPVELKEGIMEGNEVEYFPEGYSNESSNEANNDSGFKTGKEIAEEEKEKQEMETEEIFIEDNHGRPTSNLVENTLEMKKQAIIFCSSRKGAEKSSDRCAEVTEPDLSREDRQELEEYSEEILNVLGNPTSQCKRLAENVKKGAAYHHAGLINKQRKLIEEAFMEGLIRTVSATPTLAAGINLPAYRVIMRDLKRYTGQGMDWIPVLEFEQMTGRAGRPKYDDQGEAIAIAKNPGMKEEILERYILGEAEHIQSKLAAEPILRMHTLSLVASNFCSSFEDLVNFYEKTFYAHQFGDMEEVEEKIRSVVQDLIEYEFLTEDVSATKTGRRVSELYIDPDSANLILESLEKAEEKDNRPISYLFMLSRTTEMQPRPRVKDKEWSEIQNAMSDAEKYILESVPNEWEPRYEHFMECMKNAMLLQGWISEVDEERLMDKYGVAPGGIRAKMQDADWLIYASKELARLKEYEVETELEKLGIRLKHGIQEELLNLVQYDQIGRVRARKLHDHGIRDRQQIRDSEFEKLKRLIGKKTARKLKKQVGQENIFDRENIMDYF
ncbi:MAG: DEAD/DEAH box helicase [Candidatus Nanohaloarchaea archaeon]